MRLTRAFLASCLALSGGFASAEVEWKMFDRRVGLFVHWGVYSVGGYHEQERMKLGVPRAEYAKYAERFAAEKFDADKFVDAAESLGASYVVFTSKHHDGFCLWNTKTTPFNVMNTPAKRDIVGELAAACRRRGMRFGLYYSNPDWNHPNAYNPRSTHQVAPEAGDRPDMARYRAYVGEQIGELMSNYGEICCLFWDIPSRIDAPELNALVRKLQPRIRIDDRGWGADGDYSTPERGIPDGAAFVRPTEACDSVGARSWGFRRDEDYRTLGYTTRAIDRVLTMGGNYLLNVGPRADGTIPEEALDLLRRTGDWYRKVRESYEHVTTEPWLVSRDGVMATRRGDTVYIHCPKGLHATGLDLMPIADRPRRATLLNTGARLEWDLARLPAHAGLKQDFLHLKNLPADALANESAVIRLDFDRAPVSTLLEARGFTDRNGRTPEADGTSVSLLRFGDSIRLVFVFRGEDGVMTAREREQAAIQEAYGDPRGGEFALGGEENALHVAFGITGRVWCNASRNFRSSSVFEKGDWTFSIDIPLSAIPRLPGDKGAFLANFHRKGRKGVSSWRCDPARPLSSAQGGALVRLEPQAQLLGRFVNTMDSKGDFRACWTKDFHRIRFEEQGSAVAGGFRLTNTNEAGDVYFHNGTVDGAKDCFVAVPSSSASVLCTLKVKGRGKIRFGVKPWTAGKACLYPSERTLADCAIDSSDEWETVCFGFEPRPDGLYAANAAWVLPSIWLGPGGDILVDDMEIRFLNECVRVEPSALEFPAGLPLAEPPVAEATPTMRGAFVADEWKKSMSHGENVRCLQDDRMLYLAAKTEGNSPLSLTLRGADGSPVAISVLGDGTAVSSLGRPIWCFVNCLPNGRTLFRLALARKDYALP